jgi:hypothetical protein
MYLEPQPIPQDNEQCKNKVEILLVILHTSCTVFSMPSGGLVSEHMGWVRNVVLMNVYLGLEKPQGVGISGEGPHGQVREMRGGQFTSNPGKRWTDPVTARRVPSK